MDLKAIMNSPGLWVASGVMMVIVVAQACIYFKMSLKQASEVGISDTVVKDCIRSSIYTSLGPIFAMIIICVSMVALYGAPTTWMRMNDVGAARTELAVGEIAKKSIEMSPGAPGYAEKAFTYGLWGMALNNVGWFVTALLFTKQMGKIVTHLDENYDKNWVRLVMAAAMLGLYGCMLSANVIGKTNYHIVSAVTAGIVVLVLDKVFGKYKKLQEFSMGIALFVAIFVAEYARTAHFL